MTGLRTSRSPWRYSTHISSSKALILSNKTENSRNHLPHHPPYGLLTNKRDRTIRSNLPRTYFDRRYIKAARQPNVAPTSLAKKKAMSCASLPSKLLFDCRKSLCAGLCRHRLGYDVFRPILRISLRVRCAEPKRRSLSDMARG